jgi:septum formation protein
MNPPVLYLASQSPRRRILLEQLCVPFQVLPIEIDESWDGLELPADHVGRLALEKAHEGQRQISLELGLVLAADTAVVVDGEILGKAVDRDSALAMLEQLSARAHQVYTGVALVTPRQHDGLVRACVSQVYFRRLSAREREAYWATGEPLGKAGGYAIQGQAATFIERIEGSYSGVMGLPLFETAELLSLAGMPVL